jgi:hypothetical protein
MHFDGTKEVFFLIPCNFFSSFFYFFINIIIRKSGYTEKTHVMDAQGGHI